MKKLFRFHRGSLKDSLDTTIEIRGIADIAAALRLQVDSELTNIHIDPQVIEDDRLPRDWAGLEFKVLCDCLGYENQCVGFCNFYESGVL